MFLLSNAFPSCVLIKIRNLVDKILISEDPVSVSAENPLNDLSISVY